MVAGILLDFLAHRLWSDLTHHRDAVNSSTVHFSDVTWMSWLCKLQIAGNSSICLATYSGRQQKNIKGSHYCSFMRENTDDHRLIHKEPVMRQELPCHDILMTSSWHLYDSYHHGTLIGTFNIQVHEHVWWNILIYVGRKNNFSSFNQDNLISLFHARTFIGSNNRVRWWIPSFFTVWGICLITIVIL